MDMDKSEGYRQQVARLSAEIGRRRRRNAAFVAGEVASFVAMVAMVVARIAIGHGAWWWLLACGCLAVYIGVRRIDERNDELTAHLEALRAVAGRELKVLGGDYSVLGDGAEYVNPRHAYSFDLDIFGPGSLFNRIDRTVTTGGSRVLARRLEQPAADPRAMARALAELAGRPGFRAEFMSKGVAGRIDTGAVHEVLRHVSQMQLSPVAARRGALAAAIGVLGGFYACLLLALAGVVPAAVPVWWGVVQLLAVILVGSRALAGVRKAIGSLHRQLSGLSALVSLVARQQFATEPCRKAQASLAGAMESLGALERLLRGLDRRDSFVGIVVLNVFGLTDFFLVRGFLRWQQSYMDRLPDWLDAVAEMDASVAMATFAFNHPEAREAEILDGEALVYEARGLWHPFLGAAAVANDFTIADRNYYIVTGANMAGKSTFLRALGVNDVLAMCGLPVFAKSLRVSRFQLFSSMRTSDDLVHGVSYFNAELLRLKQLVGYVDSHPSRPTLIILDEILKGTNSLDKLNGSRLFLEAIARRNVSGVIATHDLELSRMADEHPGRFHNFCFEIGLGSHITYTYRIAPGVARNQNATYLLRQMLEQSADGAAATPAG